MVKNLLIISLQGLGNTIMLIFAIRKFFEDNKKNITLVLSDNGSYQFVRSIFIDNIPEIYIWNESRSSFINVLRLIIKLRKKLFDIAFAAYPSGKRENILLFFCKAKRKKILKSKKGYYKVWHFLNHSVNYANEFMHDIENNSKLFNLPISEINKKIIFNLSEQLKIGIHIGSKARSKQWKICNWFNLMQLLKNYFNCQFKVIISNEEKRLLKGLMEKNFVNFEVLSGLEFRELIKEIQGLTILIGNDSSIVHLSSFLEIPSVVIWSYAQTWRTCPYGIGNILIKKDYECIPCYDFTKTYIKKCRYNLRCINDITFIEVFEIIKQFLVAILNKRIPESADFSNIPFISKITKSENGCLILSLKGMNKNVI